MDSKHHEDHVFLDVYSIRQGALRLRLLQYFILIILFLGFYLSVSSLLNYSAQDADARDMITNMRLLIGGRQAAHNVFVNTSFPESVAVGSIGFDPVIAMWEPLSKNRALLTDPRLLSLVDPLQPMNLLRKPSSPMAWTFYRARLINVPLPPFGWQAQVTVNLTLRIDSDSLIFAVQLYNSLPLRRRPRIRTKEVAAPAPNGLGGGQYRAWASFTAEVPAFRTLGPDKEGRVEVWGLTEVDVEMRHQVVDVPTTTVQTDVTALDFDGGRPAILQVAGEAGRQSCQDRPAFLRDPPGGREAACRTSVAVALLHSVAPRHATLLYAGSLAGLRVADLRRNADVAAELRDVGQPRPYAASMPAFAAPFFLGLSLLLLAVLSCAAWVCLRYGLVNRQVRENKGAPPMFFQGMAKYRGW